MTTRESSFRHPHGVALLPFTACALTLTDFRRLAVPRAVVWGTEDTVDSLASGHTTAAALHVPLTLVPHAAHLSMLADPAGVAAAIERAAS